MGVTGNNKIKARERMKLYRPHPNLPLRGEGTSGLPSHEMISNFPLLLGEDEGEVYIFCKSSEIYWTL